jgi:hypothetical protein
MVMYSYGDPSARTTQPGSGSPINVTLNGKVIDRADCLPEHFEGHFSGTHGEEAFPDYTESWAGTVRWKRFHGNCLEANWCVGNSATKAMYWSPGTSTRACRDR